MSNDLYKALQQCLELLDSGVPAEECLARYPQHSRDLEPLLASATAGSAASFQMPVAAKLRVQRRVLAHWDQLHAPRRRWWMSMYMVWSGRWVTAAAVLVIMLVSGGVGTVAASQEAVPGSRLYTVKVLREDVRLWFAQSAEEKVQIYSNYSRERVQEILQLTASDRQDLTGVSLERLEGHLTAVDEIRAESVTDPGTSATQDLAIMEAMEAMEALDEALLPSGRESQMPEALSGDSIDTYPCLRHTLQVLQQAREQVNSSLAAVGQSLPNRTTSADNGLEKICPR